MRKSRKMRKDPQIPEKMHKDVYKFYSQGFAHFTIYYKYGEKTPDMAKYGTKTPKYDAILVALIRFL